MQNALICYLFFCLILFCFFFCFFFLSGGGGGGGGETKILHSEQENIVFIIHLLCATNSERSLVGIRIRFYNSYFLSKHKF